MLPTIEFTAAEATPLLGISSPTVINKWVHRGKLRPVGYDASGAALYLWGDLIAARLTRRNARIAPQFGV